jgi:TPR repeat protein
LTLSLRHVALGLALVAAVGAGAAAVLTGVVPLPGMDANPFPDMQVEMGKEPVEFTPSEMQGAAYAAFEEGKYLTALSLAKEAATKNDPQAYTLIGRIYAEGAGVSRDLAKAAEAYAKAASLGDVSAMISYAVMLASGNGVDKDRNKAAELFERAALTGDALANYNLGLLFLRGDGKPENPHRAAQHIRYAAERDIPSAQYDLAALYQAGTGVPNDALEAATWMSKAAGNGLTAAEYDYAVMLLRGLGLKRDEGKAVGYLRSAAEKGIPGAQNRLAHVYLDGVAGTAPNPAEAIKWRLIAKANGYGRDDKLELLVSSFPPDQVAAAQKAADEWRDRKAMGSATLPHLATAPAKP